MMDISSNLDIVITSEYGGKTATYTVQVTNVVTGINDLHGQQAIPASYTLHQNYPNPFNPATTILVDLPKTGKVNVSVFDLAGRRIATLLNGYLNAGRHTLLWDGTDFLGRRVVSGVYLYRIQATDFRAAKKMLLLK